MGLFDFFKKNSKSILIHAPFAGKIHDLTEVPDEAFSQKMLGDGIAIEPNDTLALAVLDNRPTNVFTTSHAYTYALSNGLEIIVHIGIETVQSKGQHFQCLIENGNSPKLKDPVIQFDPKALRDAGYRLISPIIIPTMELVKEIKVIPAPASDVVGGDPLMEIILN